MFPSMTNALFGDPAVFVNYVEVGTDGSAFVIDTGDQLIRARYDDGKGPSALTEDERLARVGPLRERALALMHQLTR